MPDPNVVQTRLSTCRSAGCFGTTFQQTLYPATPHLLERLSHVHLWPQLRCVFVPPVGQVTHRPECRRWGLLKRHAHKSTSIPVAFLLFTVITRHGILAVFDVIRPRSSPSEENRYIATILRIQYNR